MTPRDRLVSQITDTGEVQHVYGGAGNRIVRDENGTETRYVLDRGRSMSQVLCETDDTGTITAYYIWGSQLVARIGADTSQHYYHTNDIGNVLALTDENELITDRYGYTPFGLLTKEDTTDNPFTYVGGLGVMTESNDLYFMRARLYDSAVGRFLSKDPVEGDRTDPRALHLYVYGLNNPIVMTDPTGLTSYTFPGYDPLGYAWNLPSGSGNNFFSNAYYPGGGISGTDEMCGYSGGGFGAQFGPSVDEWFGGVNPYKQIPGGWGSGFGSALTLIEELVARPMVDALMAPGQIKAFALWQEETHRKTGTSSAYNRFFTNPYNAWKKSVPYSDRYHHPHIGYLYYSGIGNAMSLTSWADSQDKLWLRNKYLNTPYIQDIDALQRSAAAKGLFWK